VHSRHIRVRMLLVQVHCQLQYVKLLSVIASSKDNTKLGRHRGLTSVTEPGRSPLSQREKSPTHERLQSSSHNNVFSRIILILSPTYPSLGPSSGLFHCYQSLFSAFRNKPRLVKQPRFTPVGNRSQRYTSILKLKNTAPTSRCYFCQENR
jgi:hypothetical protein